MEQVVLPLDAAGFSRRECPRCHGAFKIRWSARESQVLAAALTRRVRHLNPAEAERSGTRYCPYCACEAPAEQFYTADAARHVDEQARQLQAEVNWLRLRVPHEWIAADPNLTYVSVAPVRSSTVPPDRGDDLLRIPLPCCGEEHEVTDAWLGPIRCHICGIAHLRAGPRDVGLEMALLRQWAGEPQ